MKKTFFLFILITYNCLAQNTEINKVFFNIPLHESRDSIYTFCQNSDFITQIKNKYSLTKKGIEIKTFNGLHNKLEDVDQKLDSIKFQLSTGTISISGEKGYKNQLVFFLDYILSNKKYSYEKYDELKSQINTITKKQSYGAIKRNENGKEMGKIDHWYLANDLNIDLEYEIINRKKYNIRISYYRLE